MAAFDNSSKRLEHILRPRSLVILGMSSNPVPPSRAVLKNLVVNGFSGRIYLVGRSAGMIDGYECFTSVSQLPRDLDLAVITLGAGAVRDAVTDCVAHGIKSAICFASGFAEIGDAGRREFAARLRRPASVCPDANKSPPATRDKPQCTAVPGGHGMGAGAAHVRHR
jgi:acyl-CoA synthetase (NDP forming)